MAMSDRFGDSGWRAIAALARPYRREFLAVAAFALLATATDLLAPLIYREAVNDIAGLFVDVPSAPGIGALLEVTEPGASEGASRPAKEGAAKAAAKGVLAA